MKSKILNDLARTHVGDGKKPNLFFVSSEADVVLVTTNFVVAYDYWRALSRALNRKESCLEDRMGHYCIRRAA